ncbi:MAG: hypothetical protein IKQ69_09560 [Oscillospiraceae bacterium]|nr:hypothetical protein [Oscillospiraceae bacterium]
MRKKLICCLLCAALVLGLAACGSAAPAAAPSVTEAPAPVVTAAPAAPEATATPTPTPAPTLSPSAKSYQDIYLQYLAVYAAISDEVQRRLEMHNAVLRSQYPDSYYMNSNYLMQDFTLFLPDYPAMGSDLRDGDLTAAETVLRQRWPDAELSNPQPGAYAASYTYVDKTSGKEVQRSGRCVWECNGDLGAFRVRAWLDDEMVEFTEFIPQGDDTWLLYTMSDKVLVSFTEGSVTGLWYTHRINQPAQNQFPGDVRLCSLEENDFFPAGIAQQDWVIQDADAEYTLTLEDDVMTYTGKVFQDITNDQGVKIGILWHEIDPIRLEK